MYATWTRLAYKRRYKWGSTTKKTGVKENKRQSSPSHWHTPLKEQQWREKKHRYLIYYYTLLWTVRQIDACLQAEWNEPIDANASKMVRQLFLLFPLCNRGSTDKQCFKNRAAETKKKMKNEWRYVFLVCFDESANCACGAQHVHCTCIRSVRVCKASPGTREDSGVDKLSSEDIEGRKWAGEWEGKHRTRENNCSSLISKKLITGPSGELQGEIRRKIN